MRAERAGIVWYRLQDSDTDENFRAVRLVHAIEDLLGKNQKRDSFRLLGKNLVAGQRDANARRAILLALLAVDPDATAYLGEFTGMAQAPWMAPANENRSVPSRSDVYLWFSRPGGHGCLGLLQEAIEVLAPASRIDAPESGSAPAKSPGSKSGGPTMPPTVPASGGAIRSKSSPGAQGDDSPPTIPADREKAKEKKQRRKKSQSKADKIRALLAGESPYEGTKTELAIEVGYTQAASLYNVKGFANLWNENERRLAGLRAQAQRRRAGNGA